MKTTWFIVSLVFVLCIMVSVNAAEQSNATSGWIGKWVYTDSGAETPVTFTQDGDVVAGVYAYDSPNYKSNGTLEGNISSDGKILSGTWTEKGEYVYSAEEMASVNGTADAAHVNFTKSEDGNTTLGTWDEVGTFEFTLSDDGTIWNGTFVYASDNPPVIYPWNGTKTE